MLGRPRRRIALAVALAAALLPPAASAPVAEDPSGDAVPSLGTNDLVAVEARQSGRDLVVAVELAGDPREAPSGACWNVDFRVDDVRYFSFTSAGVSGAPFTTQYGTLDDFARGVRRYATPDFGPPPHPGFPLRGFEIRLSSLWVPIAQGDVVTFENLRACYFGSAEVTTFDRAAASHPYVVGPLTADVSSAERAGTVVAQQHVPAPDPTAQAQEGAILGGLRASALAPVPGSVVQALGVGDVPYDLDVAFYDWRGDFAGGCATGDADEVCAVPARAVDVEAYLFSGADVDVTIVVVYQGAIAG